MSFFYQVELVVINAKSHKCIDIWKVCRAEIKNIKNTFNFSPVTRGHFSNVNAISTFYNDIKIFERQTGF